MKLQRLKTGQFLLCLPQPLVRAKGWEKGEELKVIIDSKGDLVIKAVKPK